MFTPPEPLKCSQDLFDRLWASRGDCCVDKDAISLAYDALSDGIASPLNIYNIYFPDEPSALLEDWGVLENWLQNIHHLFTIEDIWTANFDYWEDNAPPPVTVYPTSQRLKASVLELVQQGKYEETFPSVWGATITDGKRTVEIVYGDLDAWVLGHVSGVDVYESVGDLNEEDGYYAF